MECIQSLISLYSYLPNLISSNKDFFQAIGPFVIASAAYLAIWNTNKQNNKNRRHEIKLKHTDYLFTKYEELNATILEINEWRSKLRNYDSDSKRFFIAPQGYEFMYKARTIDNLYLNRFSFEIDELINFCSVCNRILNHFEKSHIHSDKLKNVNSQQNPLVLIGRAVSNIDDNYKVQFINNFISDELLMFIGRCIKFINPDIDLGQYARENFNVNNLNLFSSNMLLIQNRILEDILCKISNEAKQFSEKNMNYKDFTQ